MSAERLHARVSQSRTLLNIEMERELNEGRLLGVASDGGLVQLFDPQGRRHIICRSGFAAKWCSENADWTFEAFS